MFVVEVSIYTKSWQKEFSSLAAAKRYFLEYKNRIEFFETDSDTYCLGTSYSRGDENSTVMIEVLLLIPKDYNENETPKVTPKQKKPKNKLVIIIGSVSFPYFSTSVS